MDFLAFTQRFVTNQKESESESDESSIDFRSFGFSNGSSRSKNKKQKKFIINTVKNHNTNPQRVLQVIKMVHQSGGIEYTIEKMNEYQQKALSILKEMEENEARNSLEDLVNYVIERKK